MNYGKIKKWNQMSGWGFIEGDDGYDYFTVIHATTF
jgi:cold shock CspA family protein